MLTLDYSSVPSDTEVDSNYGQEHKGITFEQFEKILEIAKKKQPNEKLLFNALRPLEEAKVFDDGVIGYIINGGN